jgi:hypothetical protein
VGVLFELPIYPRLSALKPGETMDDEEPMMSILAAIDARRASRGRAA